MSAFWSSWSSLANAPTSEAAKEAVVATGKQLAASLGQLSEQLQTVANQAGEQYASLAGTPGRSATTPTRSHS